MSLPASRTTSAMLLLCADTGALQGACAQGLADLGLGPWTGLPQAGRNPELERLALALHGAWGNGACAGELALHAGGPALRWRARRLLSAQGSASLLFELERAAPPPAGDDGWRLQQLEQLVPGAFYQYQRFPDGRARVPFASQSFRSIYGVGPEAVLEDSTFLLQHVHRDDQRGFLDSIAESMHALTLWLHEYRVQPPGEALRWVRGRAMPQRQPDGSTIWHGYLVDITSEVQARQAALQREQDFQALFQEHPHAMWICEPGTLRILDANMAATVGYGIDRDAFRGSFLAERHPPDERAQLLAAQDRLGTQVWRHVDQAGAGHRVELRAQRVQYAARPGLLVVATDVTERESLLEALRESELRLALALAASGSGIWDWDLRTGIATLSDSYWALIEYEPGSVAPDMAFLQQLLHPDDRDMALQQLGQYAQGLSESGESEHRMVTRTGRVLWVKGYAKAHSVDAQGQATRLVGTIKDITAAKRAEAETANLSAQLRALSALRDQQLDEQRREFALDLHDQVGPMLGSIKLAAELAQMGDGAGRDSALGRIIALVDDGIRKVRERSWQVFSPALTMGLGAALIALMERHAAQFGFEIDVQLDPMPDWLGEAAIRELCGIVEQALCNTGQHAAASRVVLTAAAEPDELTLMVQDNGCGFDTGGAQAHAHFGLFGMRERAVRVAASLAILSAPGQGTTIVVSLPRRGAPAPRA